MRRRRNHLTKLGVILLMLLLTLALTGVAYGIWSDQSSVSGGIGTGTWDIALSSSGNYPYATSDFVSSNSTTDSFYVSSNSTHSPTYIGSNIHGKVIEVDIVNAQPDTDYFCSFGTRNIGTVPVRVQNIDISGLPAELAVQVAGIGVIIDPGQNWIGTAQAKLIDTAGTGKNFSFSIVVQSVPWNQP